jgi:hypothetical protein
VSTYHSLGALQVATLPLRLSLQRRPWANIYIMGPMGSSVAGNKIKALSIGKRATFEIYALRMGYLWSKRPVFGCMRSMSTTVTKAVLSGTPKTRANGEALTHVTTISRCASSYKLSKIWAFRRRVDSTFSVGVDRFQAGTKATGRFEVVRETML